MPLYLNLVLGDAVEVDGPAKVTIERREGSGGARVRIDADQSVKVTQHRAPRAASALAAKGLIRPKTQAQ